MSDKELEIRHQFLDEAQDYLDNLENALIGIAGGTMNVQAINAAMRSAHSIKGGAGMMGFQLLSQLSHRLEDSLKVLKIQKHAVDVNADLEQLLLTAVDCLRHVALSDRQGMSVDPPWLDEKALPVFDALYDRLGEPQEEDAASILSPEDNQDIVPLLFQTEVEGCLDRLEQLLEGDRHCLYEETEILAQELGALGEMLQLSAFSQLCTAVLNHVQAQPNQIDLIAQEALTAWRQTQSLVLAGNYSELPTALRDLPAPTAEPVDVQVGADLAELTSIDMESIDVAQIDIDASTVDTLEVDAADLSANIDVDVEADSDAETSLGHDVTAADAATQSWDAAIAQVELVDDGGEETAVFADWPSASESFAEQEVDLLSDWPDTDHRADAADGPALADDSSANDVSAADDRPGQPEVIDGDIDGDFVDYEEAAAAATYDLAADPSVDPSAEPLTDTINKQDTVAFDAFDTTFDSSVAADDSGLVDYSAGNWNNPAGEDSSALDGHSPEPAPRRAENKPNTTSFQAQNQAKNSLDADDATVRVPVRQLKQINNLFSELTIERNGVELYLKRLRALLATLRQRVKTLDQTNVNLRSAYDRVTTRAELEHSSLRTTRPPRQASAIAGAAARQLSASHALTENFDALELDQYGDMHLMSQEVMETIVQIQEVTTDLELSMDDTDHTFRGLNKTAKQLQTRMTQLQMRPLSDILERFPRALRKMSLEHGKSAELKVYGGNLLIDRNILEALNEPLLHLLRNAFDHGIEDPETRQASGKPAQGTIEIRASHRNNRTIISIHDDGKGINLDKIRARARQMGLDDMLLAAASEDELISLIFEPGFSTSSQVTDLSGRGVGMDVVRDGIKQLQGEISVDTQHNGGATFTLSLPFTLSITRVLLVESNDMMLAFPTDVIEEMTSISPDQILKGVGGEVLEWEEQVVQFIRLHEWLRFNCPRSLESPESSPNIKESTVLMVTHNDQIVGLQVGRCWGEQEVAIRHVEGNLPMPPGFSSCTILGDGRVVPMVNTSELLRWIISDERNRSVSSQAAQADPIEQSAVVNLLPGYETHDGQQATPLIPVPATSHKPAILIVDDSINVRRFLALTLEKAGYRVEQAKDGQDAVDKLSAGLLVQAILCDIEMPRLDGYGVLARIKSNPKLAHLPIAMLTSRSGDKHRKLAMSLGAAAYFSKPYNEQVLLQSLRQMVELAVTA